MAWVILSTSPQLNRASLVTGRCEACRTVPGPGSRPRTSGERKSARGHTVHTSKPRDVERAKAAERPEPQWSVGRMGSSGVCPSTGQRPTGAEGAPQALASPAGGTRSAPRVVGPADSTGRKAGQGPGGQGCGNKPRPSGHRRERTIKSEGDIPPERVLTSHRSSRKSRKTGDGPHGPHGRVISDTARPWRSADRRVPGRLETGGAEGPTLALSDLPSGPGATLETGAEPDPTAPTQ